MDLVSTLEASLSKSFTVIACPITALLHFRSDFSEGEKAWMQFSLVADFCRRLVSRPLVDRWSTICRHRLSTARNRLATAGVLSVDRRSIACQPPINRRSTACPLPLYG